MGHLITFGTTTVAPPLVCFIGHPINLILAGIPLFITLTCGSLYGASHRSLTTRLSDVHANRPREHLMGHPIKIHATAVAPTWACLIGHSMNLIPATRSVSIVTTGLSLYGRRINQDPRTAQLFMRIAHGSSFWDAPWQSSAQALLHTLCVLWCIP